MLDYNQIKELAKLFKTNESVVAREYIQTLFLKELYDKKFSQEIFFKGGTSIRLLFGGKRFSEDLDFTVMMDKSVFELKISNFWKYLEKIYGWKIKRKKTLEVGETYLLTVKDDGLDYSTFIKLDFSFREKVLSSDKSIIKTDYPVVFSSFIHHLAREEILAEKIRAVMTREKGRDIYDLWFLLSLGVEINTEMVLDKLKYYRVDSFDSKELIKRIEGFGQDQFIIDLRPFVPINEREKLGNLFDYILAFLKDKFN